ncbi:transglycosylase SLT domain-containing protein [Enterobacter ludwigii]|uniref:transglycosylase SLT domain-containing protein n=1 Tax=Enterobacter ludwigii TaxID=299767 RepID=UPI0013D4B963|nr:transglycosylase SLT domain-containing protein [Enterobacter ludwigii]
MAGDQLPVLTLDFDDEKIKALQDISEKFKAAFSVGPGGFPLPQPLPPAHPQPHPGSGGKKPEVQSTFEKFMKSLKKDAQGTLKTFRLINKTLGTTTSALKGLFAETVTWSTRIAAIGGGGLFGYGFMAQHVSNQYKASQGLGITTGQMQAANNVYGSRISGTGNIMQALAAAQNDPNNQNYAGLVNMGINPQDGAAANMPKLLSRVSQLLQQYKGTGVSQTILKANGLDGIIDVATANQILANSDRLPQLNQQFKEQSKRLDRDMGSGTQQSWQELSAKFMTNADSIGNTFLHALARLNGPIGRISDELTADIERFINGRNGKALFDMLANGLEKVGKWLGSDDFQHDLQTFSTAVKNVAIAIGHAIEWLAHYGIKVPKSVDEARSHSSFDVTRTKQEIAQKGQTPQQAAKENAGVLGFLRAAGNTTLGLMTGGRVTIDSIEERWKAGGWSPYKDALVRNISATNDNAGLPKGLMPAVAGTESSWNPRAFNTSSGAAGLFQFTVDTGNRYGLSAVDRFDPEKSADAAARYFQDNLKRYGGDIAKTLAQYNGGNVAVTANGDLNLKKETVDYLLKILPQVQNGLEQHPGILRQLEDADTALAKGGKNDRATIHLQIGQMPGSEISAQVKGIYNTPR